MSLCNFKKIADIKIQPKDFKFTKENQDIAKNIIKMYPKKYIESSIMPLLSLAQVQNKGWLPTKAIDFISKMIDVSEIKILEIATFYSMYNLSPVGEYHLEVCTTSPCMLRGSDDILKLLKNEFGIDIGEISKDKKFSINKVECLGACVNAPVLKINENYFEDLNLKSTKELINKIQNNKKIKSGPQSNRKGSEPRKKAL
tara:strand:- start:190 stop:789 length:600 start_codon:yes stop_codon:yes gene_type:complete